MPCEGVRVSGWSDRETERKGEIILNWCFCEFILIQCRALLTHINELTSFHKKVHVTFFLVIQMSNTKWESAMFCLCVGMELYL